MITVTRRFHFSYAHHLPGHKHCGQIHGHNGVMDVTVRGLVKPDTGMVMDFQTLDKIVKVRIISKLDHTCIDDLFLWRIHSMPTAESIVQWVAEQLKYPLSEYHCYVDRVRLYETPNSWAEWTVDP